MTSKLKKRRSSGPNAGRQLHTELKSRKEKRKEGRKQKKQLKQIHFQKKHGHEVAQAEPDSEPEERPQVEPRKKDVAAQREKEMEKRRKRRLRAENEAEDQNIRQLEKQLKLNKRKKKDSLPKSFAEDGLDYLLDALDPSKLEQGLHEESEDEDELEGDSADEVDPSDDDEVDEPVDSQDEELDEEFVPEADEPTMATSADEAEADLASVDGDDVSNGEPESTSEVEDEPEDQKDPKEGLWEDIYGRQRDSQGNVISGQGAPAPSKYIPPAMRAKLVGSESEKRKQELLKLQRKVKGLLNRLAFSNLAFVAKQIESLFMCNSRNDMNETLLAIFSESLISPVLTPERLIMEHAVLLAILHVNIGLEVGATMVQAMAKTLDHLRGEFAELEEGDNPKDMDNVLLVLTHLYSFKVIDCVLIFDILNLLADEFTGKSVELILILLRSVGFNLRKDDPMSLKALISKIQSKSSSADKLKEDSRVKFMLEALTAIKNNNVKKIPNYDSEHQQRLSKNLKAWFAPGKGSNPLKVTLNELLQADERGRWWIVGSAWAGKERDPTGSSAPKDSEAFQEPSFSAGLLDLARKMRMTTDVRKNIFCALMSADDYLDAFEKVLKVTSQTNQREREIAFVLLDCCLQEQVFNPFYAQLCCKFASYDRKYRMAVQFALWDRIKEMDDLKPSQLKNLSGFAHYVIRTGALSMAALKVVEFADLNKVRVKFLRSVLTSMLQEDKETLQRNFSALANVPDLKILREGLRLFMRHFLLKGDKEKKKALLPKVQLAETAMMFEI